MAKSARQLFKERVRPEDIGNPQLRRQLKSLYSQNYQQQLAQVNANYQAGLEQGLTPGQAATTWVLPGRNAQYTVKEGDNLTKIAEATSSTPDAILSANPDMKAPVTGMVLNTPNAYQQSERAVTGGIGLPSNAAQGGLTNNPQGFNRYAAATPQQLQAYGVTGQNRPTPAAQPQGFNLFGTLNNPNRATPGAAQSFTDTLLGLFGNRVDTERMSTAALRAQGNQPTPATPIRPGTPPAPTINQTSASQNAFNTRRTTRIQGVANIMERVSSPDYTPTQREIDVLRHYQIIKPSSPQANGGMYGNYSYGAFNGRRGGGGGAGRGGGGGRVANIVQPRYNPDDNLPAFSGGASYRGLVNWRI